MKNRETTEVAEVGRPEVKAVAEGAEVAEVAETAEGARPKVKAVAEVAEVAETAEAARPKVIFFGNGPLAEYALAVLEQECQVIFRAHTRDDLAEAVRLKSVHPDAYGVLASFGVLIPSSVLEAFEPEGILNIHPSLLPLYRGASPIESALIDGETVFGVSVMKLAQKMDAGPIYAQTSLSGLAEATLDKDFLYKKLAQAGASEVVKLLKSSGWPEPTPQDEAKATYCAKFERGDGELRPEAETAAQIYRKIVAFQGFPKPKYTFYGKKCIILAAHLCQQGEKADVPLACADGQILSIDLLQPEGKRPMEAKAFLNGYKR